MDLVEQLERQILANAIEVPGNKGDRTIEKYGLYCKLGGTLPYRPFLSAMSQVIERLQAEVADKIRAHEMGCPHCVPTGPVQ